MKKISDILNKTLSKFNLTDSAFSLTVILRTKKHAVDIFWEKILKNIDVQKFQNNTIFIKCINAAWAQELQLCRQEISEQLQKDFPEKPFFGMKIFH